jgi:probable F420-dependent oxidoreductase
MGANPHYHPEVPVFYYPHESVIREPFPLMSYLAAITTTLELVSGMVILPQRPTALVAKQAAEVDVLSGGRLRLGLGVGWNPVEFEALGEHVRDRGQRCDEQIAVLRLLWTEEAVNTGPWHRINHASIKPLPIQRPIPLWIGSGALQTPIPPEAGMRRIARMADGWMPLFPLDDAGMDTIVRVRRYTEAAGRDPSTLGMEGRIGLAGTNPEAWMAHVQGGEEAAATPVAVGTSGGAMTSVREPIDAMQRFTEVTGL